MARANPTRSPQHAFENECYRVTLRHGPQQWSFVFTAADAPAVMKRVAELARDPDAPLDWLDARSVCLHIARLRAEMASTSGRVTTGPDPTP